MLGYWHIKEQRAWGYLKVKIYYHALTFKSLYFAISGNSEKKILFITYIAQWVAMPEVCKNKDKTIQNSIQCREWIEEHNTTLAFIILQSWTWRTKASNIIPNWYFYTLICIKIKCCILSFAWFNTISIMFWKYNFKSQEKKLFPVLGMA